jgi:hypothetical protein
MNLQETTPQGSASEPKRTRERRRIESRPTEVVLMRPVPKFDPELVSEAKRFSAEFKTLYSGR